jgi:hypothetical protein
MIRLCESQASNGGFAPATPGFNAVAPEWLFNGAADAAPAFPAAESTLGSHPCVALFSAQVFPGWINRNLAGNAFPANGDNPLNFVSHAKGSLQGSPHAGMPKSMPILFLLFFRHSCQNIIVTEVKRSASLC